MKDYLLDLAEINFWQSNKLRDHVNQNRERLETINTPYGSFFDLIFHLYEAINFWLGRINGTWMNFKIRDEEVKLMSLDDLLVEWIQTDTFWISEMEKLPDNVDRTQKITYKNYRGEIKTMGLFDAVSHLSHHCFYHKGQIAMLFRQEGLPPVPPIDAVYYYLEN